MSAVGNVRLDTAVLDKLARALGTNTNGAVAAVATQIEAMAKSNIIAKDIIDTGALLGSVHTEKKSDGVYWVADGVEYGVHHELGTHKIDARSFMTPAVEAVNGQIADIMKRELFS